MPYIVKITGQIKHFSIQELHSDCSICMTAIRYRGRKIGGSDR